MEPHDSKDLPARHDADRGYADDIPGGISTRVVQALSLLMVLALILAGSSVIIFTTDNGLRIILAIVAIAAVLLFMWGFRARDGRTGIDQ